MRNVFLSMLIALVAVPGAYPFAKKARKTTRPAARKSAGSSSRQLTPTPERYRDIQQALADKGYLKSEPNGVWDAQSMDAMRQFQADKNLTVTGKISSASLIALGLGSKPDAASETGAVQTPASSPASPEPAPVPAAPK